jgi:hypothetical protein
MHRKRSPLPYPTIPIPASLCWHYMLGSPHFELLPSLFKTLSRIVLCLAVSCEANW